MSRSSAVAGAVAGRREEPRPAAEQIRARVLEAADRRAAERMPADEREARPAAARAASTIARFVLPVSVTTAALLHVLVELVEQRQVLPHRRRQNHEVGLGEHDRIVGGDVDGVQPHRGLEHVLAVDADDERRRPELPRRQGDRSADQPEADDADPLERRAARRAAPAPG